MLLLSSGKTDGRLLLASGKTDGIVNCDGTACCTDTASSTVIVCCIDVACRTGTARLGENRRDGLTVVVNCGNKNLGYPGKIRGEVSGIGELLRSTV